MVLIRKIKIPILLLSEVYRVGDDSGWNSGTGTNYLSWSEKYNFTVGDVLVFRYSTVQHDVKEVTGTTHRSCDTRTGVLAITLFVAKITIALGAMRFIIRVYGANISNNTTTINPTPPPSSSNKRGGKKRSSGKISALAIRGKVVHIVGMGILATFMS